jgi:hypothetical protein
MFLLAIVGPRMVGSVGACCNVIPVFTQPYPSTVGSVQQRLVAPGNEVKVFHTGCDPGPFFSPTSSLNVVTVTFTPDLQNPTVGTTAVPIASAVPGDCASFGCESLTFVMPLSDDKLPPTGDGLGPTGPAKIHVEVNGKIAADIGPLFEPTTGCDRVREEVFKHFTVLPTPNDVTALAQGASVRMTLDGGDDLLIPLDHRSARAAAAAGTTAAAALTPLPIFERGFGTFCARQPPWYSCFFDPKIDEEIAGAPRTPDLIQAFTIEGQHVVPLLDRDDDGRLFGITDTDYSVIRIERAPKSAPTSFRYDQRYRLKDGKGPIVYTPSDGVETAVCHTAKLQGLSVTPDIVTHADVTNTVQIHRVARAGKNCGKSSKMTAALGPDPAIAAGGSVAAFLRASDTTVRAFDETGQEYTSNPGRRASTDPVVNRWPLAVEGEHVYFRTPSATLSGTSSIPTLTVYDPDADTFTAIGPAERAEVRGTRAIALDAAANVWAHGFGDASTTSLGVQASRVANGGDVLAAAVGAKNTLTAWLWPPVTAITTSAQADDLGTTRGCSATTCRTRIVLITSEREQMQDLNGDGDQSDRVLRLYDAFNQQMAETRDAAAEFVAGDRLVAFRVPEAAQGQNGTDLNLDGDKTDNVMHALVFDDTPAGFHVVNSGYAALGADGPWRTLGWRTPYVVVGQEILFLTSQPPGAPVWLVVYHPPSDTVQAVAPIQLAAPVQVFVVDTPQGPSLQGSGLAVGDADRDGVLDPFDNCQTDGNARQHDDDHDGLGDRACDRALCTDFTPRRLGDRVVVASQVIDSAQSYLKQRAAASLACHEHVAAEPGTPDLDLLCRGSFVANVENAPLEARTREAEEAERALLAALGVPSHDAATLSFARQVIRAHGEAVNAATRAVYGAAGCGGNACAGTQQKLGRAVARHLIDLVGAMSDCLFGARHRESDLAEACLGRIEQGSLVIPWDRRAREPFEMANARLQDAVDAITDDQLRELATCASATGERGCFVCTNWRNAVRVVLSMAPSQRRMARRKR